MTRRGAGVAHVVDEEDRYAAASTGRSATRLRVEEAGACLVASLGGVQRQAARAVAEVLPAEDGRIAVVMPQFVATAVPQLVQQLRTWVPIRWESVRLVSAGAAATNGAGRAAAQLLADGLGVEVIAPDGDVFSVPGGSLFVVAPNGAADPAGGERGAWWRFRPGREAQGLGRRFPEPEWERHLAALSSSTFGHLTGARVQEIPSGLWIRRPGPVSSGDLVFAVPVHPTAVALVVSRPGDTPLRTADVRQLIEALPPAVREQLVLIPYGDDPVQDARLGEIGSEAANQTLRVRTGLPLDLVGQGRHVVAVRGGGVPAWRPFAVELAWRPYGGARVHSWVPPADNLLPLGPAQLALNDRWLVEVVEAGLWIREIERMDEGAPVRELPLQAEHCTIVVGAPDPRQERPPWRLIERLLRQLPPDARHRVRLVVPEEAGERMARAAARVQSRIVGGHVWLLVKDGRLVPLPRPSEYPWPGRVDDVDVFPAKLDETNDTRRLLSFVDELRRTPAWDEEVSDVEDDLSDAEEFDYFGDVGYVDDEPLPPARVDPATARQEPEPQPRSGPPPAAAARTSDPWQDFHRPVTVPAPEHAARGADGQDAPVPSRGRLAEEPDQRVLPRRRWPGEARP